MLLAVLPWSDSLSRQIVNMIPLNWGLIAMCLLFAFLADETRRTAWENSATPQRISAAQFLQLSDAGTNHKFVSVRGRLYPQYALHYDGSKSGDLVPMVDSKTKRGFWVDNPGISQDGEVEISGLMWQMSTDLRSDVERASGAVGQRIGGVTLDSGIKLSAGETPGNGLLPLLAQIGLGAVALGFGLMSLGKNIVFQRQKSNYAAQPDFARASESAPVAGAGKFLLSGKMRLHAKCARRFLAMPAEFARLSDGTLALVTLTDASTYSNGGISKMRAGLWLCVPQMANLKISEGRQFSGWKARPALRLRFGDGLSKGSKSSVYLSFENAAARDAARRNLENETMQGNAFA